MSRFIPIKEVAKNLREFLKKNKEFKNHKFSITTDRGTFTQKIYVALMVSPENPFKPESKYYSEAEDGSLYQYGCYHFTKDCYERSDLNEKYMKMFQKIKEFLWTMNYDDSDIMTDYFDRGFYEDYSVGKWDKDFIIKPV
ncbi:LPD29 domain-containing protein [uncultured Arcobacter sp.]|uniref:LPD29 domain-containing protein n=1 Tax=uncultured Arcobacter sp. TaxID=165434 RepID=UPI002628FB75|nr:LPD29 domain-containing protein [uncultured Arcobacter sp.]